MSAEKCPVCDGSGNHPDDGYSQCPRTCHGCNGRGWVNALEDQTITSRSSIQMDGNGNFTKIRLVRD